MLAALQALHSCSAYCVGDGIMRGEEGGCDLEMRIVDLPLTSIHFRPWDPGTLLEVDCATMCH